MVIGTLFCSGELIKNEIVMKMSRTVLFAE